LAMAEKAKEAGDEKEYEKHSHAFERFQVRIEEIETAQGRLNTEVTEASEQMDKYILQLSDFQAEIEKMPQGKAEAIADFVSAKQIVELNDRLQGLETSLDKGPISAVLEANKRLTAKARISQKLSNADVRLQDKEYERAGRTSTARSKMDEMLAARKLEKEQKTGEKAEAATEKADDRPKI
jgi:phage shock protein A